MRCTAFILTDLVLWKKEGSWKPWKNKGLGNAFTKRYKEFVESLIINVTCKAEQLAKQMFRFWPIHPNGNLTHKKEII